MKRYARLALAFAAVLGLCLIASCGGSSGPNPIEGSSTWNDLVWNEDNWGP